MTHSINFKFRKTSILIIPILDIKIPSRSFICKDAANRSIHCTLSKLLNMYYSFSKKGKQRKKIQFLPGQSGHSSNYISEIKSVALKVISSKEPLAVTGIPQTSSESGREAVQAQTCTYHCWSGSHTAISTVFCLPITRCICIEGSIQQSSLVIPAQFDVNFTFPSNLHIRGNNPFI